MKGAPLKLQFAFYRRLAVCFARDFFALAEEKFIEKSESGKAIKNWFQESTGAEKQEWFFVSVMEIHRNRAKNKPQISFLLFFYCSRSFVKQAREKLICGWLYQKHKDANFPVKG